MIDYVTVPSVRVEISYLAYGEYVFLIKWALNIMLQEKHVMNVTYICNVRCKEPDADQDQAESSIFRQRSEAR